MTDPKDLDGVVNSLFVAAGVAVAVFVAMVAFNPEERGNGASQIPQSASQFEDLDEYDDETPTPGPDGETPEDRRRSSLSRDERARAMGRWNW
ncbi:MAG: hypothetical protein FJZ01_22160 [Candidatus Sericytochromatia bacterium]|nr:hypothetical protein [Candidatus Tanganyikabacteria bacterium]